MIDKDDLTLIAHCIAVANNHSAPEDYVKLVVDAGFPFNATAAFTIIQAPELTVIDQASREPSYLTSKEMVLTMPYTSSLS